MRISIIGVRGIPACYGGFDTFVEELATGLTAYPDIRLTVFCRAVYYKERPRTFQGIRLIYLPAPRLKGLESLLHSFFAALVCLFRPTDCAYFVDEGNAPFCAMLRFLGKKTILHTDGLGWKRKKWSKIERAYYRFSAWLSAKTAHILITDNPVLKTYYKKEFQANSYYIAYGSESPYGFDDTALQEYKLATRGYLLVVARLVQENNVDIIIREYVNSSVSMPLVVVGDNPYDTPFVNQLKSLADKRVIFTGSIYRQEKLNSLYKHAYLYLHGHEVGGTNPSLLRAMGMGTAVLVLNVAYNQEVVNTDGFTFGKEYHSLRDQVSRLCSTPETVREKGELIYTRAMRKFTWKSVIEKHYKIFRLIAPDASKKYPY